MERLTELKVAEAPCHDVLAKSWVYDLRQLRVSWGYGEFQEGVVELELSTHEEYVVLRFVGIADLFVPASDVISAVSIKILDMSKYMPEVPAKVRVQHPKGGGLSFWAREVLRIA